jgi:glycosyltransferase involved in cell wall biosynthesis
MTERLLLLMGFAEEDTKMASVRWRRFRKYLHRDGVDLEWVTVRLPYCQESASVAAKAAGEFKVLGRARALARQLAQQWNRQTRAVALASIPTLDPLYVGAMLKRLAGTNVELVLEIRDVYARPEIYEYGALRRRLEIFKESMLVGYADKVIYLTDEIRRRYCSYYPHLSSIQTGVVITNGYDPEEYGPCPPTLGRNGLLEINYFGSFYGTRNPDLLFQTLHRIRSNYPRRAAVARVHIWGELGNYPLQEKVTQYDLQDAVLYHGVASHESIMKDYSSAGVNLIITHTAGSSYALPGKLFECMGAARPVWAITDDQILRDLIARHRLGYLSSHEIGSIESTLLRILRDHTRAGRLPSIHPPKDFAIDSLSRELKSFLTNGHQDA